MKTIKNLKIISTSIGVPLLFSLALMSVAFISIAPGLLGQNERFTYGIGGSIVALFIVYIFLRVDRKSWSDYLTLDKQTLIRFMKGSAAGLILASAMFLIQTWYSGLQISFADGDLGRFAWMALSLIPLAFMEELAFRSYPFFKLNETYGAWVAQFVIAILFALYHYVGGWTLLASFIGPGVWSFAFGLLALKSKGISLPTGFHFGLNLALAAIGSKYWIPGLFTIDFASVPTEEMIKSNEYFGGVLQLTLFIVLLVFTYRYVTKINQGSKSSD